MPPPVAECRVTVMSEWLGILAALAVFVLPLVLAWWMLWHGQREPRRDDRAREREKMPR